MNFTKLVFAISLIFASFAAFAGTPHPVGKWCQADQAAHCAGMEWGTGLGKCLHEANKNAPGSITPLCMQHHPKLFGANPPPATSNGQ